MGNEILFLAAGPAKKAAEEANATYGNVIIVTLSFVLLIILLRVFVWKNVASIFEERQTKIAKDLDDAELARSSAETALAQREAELAKSKGEANEIITNAKATGETNRTKIIAEAQDEARRLKDKANQDIEAQKQSAMNSIKDDVASLAYDIATKVLEKELDGQAHSDIIDSYIGKLGEV
ncbi:MAG: F0F1 ATP synthase subunit B [Lactobacillales bacterium]|jgi:F-type H+-transporting ATPase subunit b|nr:F0F1 ATP synthase subunit B [Lactobacillales bacterium]